LIKERQRAYHPQLATQIIGVIIGIKSNKRLTPGKRNVRLRKLNSCQRMTVKGGGKLLIIC
jgi:hypothetical protein